MYGGGKFIPIFPLPDTVLFPGIILPLHIFEPRYRLLLSEVLDTHGKIAVALTRKHGAGCDVPNVHLIMGVGHVMTYETRPDGTSFVFLVGDKRVRVREWDLGARHFHRGRMEALAEVPVASKTRRKGLRVELQALLDRHTERSGKNGDFLELQRVFRTDDDVGFLADFLAHHFVDDAERKQMLLEVVDVERRAHLLREALEAGDGSPEGAADLT